VTEKRAESGLATRSMVGGTPREEKVKGQVRAEEQSEGERDGIALLAT
jgi:hypothetical protein